jgi:hypothetical protein
MSPGFYQAQVERRRTSAVAVKVGEVVSHDLGVNVQGEGKEKKQDIEGTSPFENRRL